MKIVEPKYEILTDISEGGIKELQQIERVARVHNPPRLSNFFLNKCYIVEYIPKLCQNIYNIYSKP